MVIVFEMPISFVSLDTVQIEGGFAEEKDLVSTVLFPWEKSRSVPMKGHWPKVTFLQGNA